MAVLPSALFSRIQLQSAVVSCAGAADEEREVREVRGPPARRGLHAEELREPSAELVAEDPRAVEERHQQREQRAFNLLRGRT